jgi:hypothetical protein
VRARLLRPDWHLTTDLLVGFRTDWLRREQAMKTAGRETPNSRARLCNEPSQRRGRLEPSLLTHTGWKVRKHPAAGEVFFLTSPFIELIRTWARIASDSPSEQAENGVLGYSDGREHGHPNRHKPGRVRNS